MRFSLVLLISVVFFCFECQESIDSQVILYKRMTPYDTLDSKLAKKDSSDYLKYEIILSENDFVFDKYFFNQKTKGLIYEDSINCILTDSVIINTSSRDFMVYKYFFDIDEVADEESNLFYVQEYGILVGYNVGWFVMNYAKISDETSKELVESILKDEKFLKEF